MNKRQGVCVRWGGRGYGFIQDSETKIEHYCHVSSVENRVGLEPGVQVEFEIAPFTGKKKDLPVAIFVKPLPRGEDGQ